MKLYLTPGECSLADHIALQVFADRVEARPGVREALQHEGLA